MKLVGILGLLFLVAFPDETIAQTTRLIVPSDVGIQVPFGAVGDLLVAGPATSQIQDSSGASSCGGGSAFACALPNRLQVGTASNTSSLWPDTRVAGTSTASQLYSITGTGQASAGYIAGSFNTRSSDAATDTGGVTEGIQVIAVNDRTTGVRSTWGIYTQVMYTSTTAGTQVFGAEFTITNNNPIGTEDPFNVNHGGWAHGFRIDCGDAAVFGGTTSNNCQNAIDIVNNGKQFSTGIVFGSTALDTSILANPPAISLPSSANGYGIYWYTAAATPKWKIFSIGTDANAKSIRMGNNIISYLDESGTIDFSLSVTQGGQVQIGSSAGPNCGNFLQMSGQGNGLPPVIQSQGCLDANIGIQLAPKGTGFVSINNLQAGTPVASLCIDASNNIINKTTTGSCI
jgi:hypothetical protein